MTGFVKVTNLGINLSDIPGLLLGLAVDFISVIITSCEVASLLAFQAVLITST